MSTPCHEVKAAGAPLPTKRITHYRTTYDRIFTIGEAANTRALPLGKRGGTKQSKALNLIDRLRLYADDVWCFLTDHRIPFTNNLGQQAEHMPRSNRKVSCGFRIPGGLDTFCTIRSYLENLHKRGRITSSPSL